MKVVITGATSFIGTAAVRQILNAGHEVCAVVRPGSANLAHLWEQVPEDLRGAMQVVELDLMKIRELASGQEQQRFDAWIHIGWDGAGSENRTKREVQQSNVQQSLEAVRTAAALGCRRFIFTGSQAEYGIYHERIQENLPCHPVSEYGKAKVDFYNQAKSLCKSLKMEYIHTRIFSIYGSGDHPWSLVQSCIRTWNAGEAMQFGPCTQLWNFLYIDDMARVLCHLLTEGAPGVYNVAGDDTRPLRSYIEELYRLCGNRGGYTYGERPQNAEGPADLNPDISKLLEATTWRPQVNFAEGIHRMLAEG